MMLTTINGALENTPESVQIGLEVWVVDVGNML
jgi:hypothetical protein